MCVFFDKFWMKTARLLFKVSFVSRVVSKYVCCCWWCRWLIQTCINDSLQLDTSCFYFLMSTGTTGKYDLKTTNQFSFACPLNLEPSSLPWRNPYDLYTHRPNGRKMAACLSGLALRLCFDWALHLVSNESEVRGLWSLIIFIWETVRGCSTFASPLCDTIFQQCDKNRALIIYWGCHPRNKG